MKQPLGYEGGRDEVLLLRKSIYGLCQSARAFYFHLDSLLRKLGWKRLHAEWAIWVSSNKKSFIGCHVDDMLVGAKRHVADTLRLNLGSYCRLQISEMPQPMLASASRATAVQAQLLATKQPILKKSFGCSKWRIVTQLAP